jgi:4-hydroxybenzoate polyprenyltransferase
MVKNLFQLVRWKNLLIAGGTILLTKYAIFEPAINTLFPFSSPSLNLIETLLLAISVMTIAAGGYIINDINDIKTDLINKPKK